MEEYLQGLKYQILKKNVAEIPFRDLQHDSRLVKRGDVFVALDGNVSDGHDFIQEAYENGAVCMLVSKEVSTELPVTYILVENLRENLGKLSSDFYEWPQKKLTIIGFTGTKGKTSSTYFLEKILGEEQVARIGTIEYKVGREVVEANNTTPESLDIVKICKKAVEKNIRFLVMEVSSHALELGRVNMMKFDVVVFTNLKQDHLDFHKTMDAYFKAKKKLFFQLKDPKNSVINIDDFYGKHLHEEFQGLSYGLACGDITGKILTVYSDRQKVEIQIFGKEYVMETQLLGRYNLYNLLGVVGAAKILKISDEQILSVLKKLKGAPGRFQLVNCPADITVIVDYSHTEDALFNILISLNEIKKRKIITILGCGGDRDRTKRPKMGKVAEDYSDFVIITSDNPRTEEPREIIREIVAGLQKENHMISEDREQAIVTAIEMAEKNDLVLIAGKGHETYQIFGHEKYHFDDEEIACRELVKRKQKNSPQ